MLNLQNIFRLTVELSGVYFEYLGEILFIVCHNGITQWFQCKVIICFVASQYQGAHHLRSQTVLWLKRLQNCVWYPVSRLILGLRPANKSRRYKVTPSPIGWAQT